MRNEVESGMRSGAGGGRRGGGGREEVPRGT
jgi:hypothetical protein